MAEQLVTTVWDDSSGTFKNRWGVDALHPSDTPVIPAVSVYTTVNQSCSINTWVTVNFPSETVSNASMHSTTVNNSRVYALYSGYYNLSFSSFFDYSTLGCRAARLAVDGVALSTPGTSWQTPALTIIGIGSQISGSKLVKLTAGQYIELQVQQTGIASLAMSSASLDLNFLGAF